jgi:hypothetical protein
MAAMTAKAAIARILKLEGVELLSCFPENPIIDACAAEGIRPIIARSERVVVNISWAGSTVSARSSRINRARCATPSPRSSSR